MHKTINTIIPIETKLDDERCVPYRAHKFDAGADLKSMNNHVIWPGETTLVDTGVAVKIPPYYVGLVFSRSGQGKINVSLANSVGVIDSEYRGNIKVLLTNSGMESYEVKAFETKIAQLVIVPVLLTIFGGYEGDWDDTKRSIGGFGSTG